MFVSDSSYPLCLRLMIVFFGTVSVVAHGRLEDSKSLAPSLHAMLLKAGNTESEDERIHRLKSLFEPPGFPKVMKGKLTELKIQPVETL